MREQHLTGVEDAGSARRIDDAIAAQADTFRNHMAARIVVP